MTEDEAIAMRAMHDLVLQLYKERDDMSIGITSSILDLYRINFTDSKDTRNTSIARLKARKEALEKKSPKQMVTAMLASIIEAIETDKIDAAKLARDPAAT